MSSQLLILAWMPNELAGLRIGFVVSKRISKHAVERNHIKRLLSEAIRPVLPGISGGWDIVISARNLASSADVYMFEQDITKLLRRARLLTLPPDKDRGSRPAFTSEGT
jgi:ribonuclease P protein component